MARTAKQHVGGCPVAFGIDIFGDRWTLLVLRDMILHGKRRYGDFLDAEEGIATNILADRLAHLEGEGVVEKMRDPDNRRSYIYKLTRKGLDLTPVLLEIIRWSGKYRSLSKARQALLKRIETDKERLVAEIYAREGAASS